jgi:hypothetical protein
VADEIARLLLGTWPFPHRQFVMPGDEEPKERLPGNVGQESAVDLLGAQASRKAEKVVDPFRAGVSSRVGANLFLQVSNAPE